MVSLQGREKGRVQQNQWQRTQLVPMSLHSQRRAPGRHRNSNRLRTQGLDEVRGTVARLTTAGGGLLGRERRLPTLAQRKTLEMRPKQPAAVVRLLVRSPSLRHRTNPAKGARAKLR